MTLKQAMSKLDAAPVPKPSGFFDRFDDWCEAREPGYKAKEAQKAAARDKRRQERRAAVLKRFGSLDLVFALNPIEAALWKAATPFATRKVYRGWIGGAKTLTPFTVELGGSDEFRFLKTASPGCVDAIRSAWPMPAPLAKALAESRMWRDLSDDRQAFVDGEYRHHREVDARIELVEHELNTRPGTSWDDMQARFDWKRFEWERQWIDPTEESEDSIVSTLRRDFEMLRRIYDRPAQNGQAEGVTTNVIPSERRTNADKRRDVLSMLDAEPHLPDREIARRLGVSPQTVSNWRRRI
ncbi:winged helix-turn-helix domain-containing protein [Bosea sp. PAMC 26642]|uniref:winged helix-turn-helix domain-containing protein n=1 Tax=Bosea sp. (strain PAMC 26642) TaxID=1792307 RepID=UPI0007705942|nr:winged helix-turn-helix domain-containing protein [Bosea sp. PAMC 26642]AMJ59391.1 hypothetical protein AXW83_02900 [Bosea sp. PAMC 26642]